MTDLSRILDERMDDRIIAAINDLDFKQFQDLIANLLGHIGVKVVSREEEGDAILFRGEGDEGLYLVLASRLFDHGSVATMRRLRSLATNEGRNPVLLITNDLEPEARRMAERENVSYADKPKILLLLRKYELADGLMKEIDQRILQQDGARVLPSAGKFDHHFKTALDDMDKGHFKEALFNLDRALELKPNQDDVWQARANVLLNLGRLEEALDSCNKATTLRPGDQSSWYLLGLIKGQMGDYEGEVKAYDRVLKLQPNNRSALLNKGTALYRARKNEQALKVYDQMIKIYPNDAMAYNNRGIVLKSSGRLVEAMESFAKAIALDRNYVNPIINTGLIHSETGRHDLAIEDWKKALQIERRRPELWLSLGLSQRAVGDFDSALTSLDKALELDPGLEEARRQRDEIEALLAPPIPPEPAPMEKEPELVSEAPEEPTPEAAPLVPLEEPGSLVVKKEEERHPVEVIPPGPLATMPEEVAAIAATEEGVRSITLREEPGPLSETKEDERRLAEAERASHSLMEPTVSPTAIMLTSTATSEKLEDVPEAPLDPSLRSRRTIEMLLLVGDDAQALQEVDRALIDEPDAIDLRRLRARALVAAGRADGALSALTDLYLLEKDERTLYDIESLSFRFNQKAEGARLLGSIEPSQERIGREMCLMVERAQYDDVIAKAPRAAANSTMIIRSANAISLMMKGRYRDAAKLWKEVLEVHTGSAEALNNLGACMRFMGEFGYEEPIHYMTMATIIDPMYSDAWNNIGCVYFAAGAYDEALRSLKKAIEIDRRPEYYLNLSSAQMAIGDVDGAKDSLTSALKLEESPEVLFMLAIIAEREGEMRWAQKLYEDAISLKPDFRDAIFNLQRVKLFLKYNK